MDIEAARSQQPAASGQQLAASGQWLCRSTKSSALEYLLTRNTPGPVAIT